MNPDDCWAVPPRVLPINAIAWSVWQLLGTQWRTAGMGGVIGWDGYETATRLLERGYRLSGDELLAEVDRLSVLEASQMEIESAVLKQKTEKEKKRGNAPEDTETVQGDLEDFTEA